MLLHTNQYVLLCDVLGHTAQPGAVAAAVQLGEPLTSAQPSWGAAPLPQPASAPGMLGPGARLAPLPTQPAVSTQ